MIKKDEGNNEDEEEDSRDDQEMIKEENRSEFDLQLTLSEIIGILFKTHKPKIGNLLNQLFTELLPNALNSDKKEKQKFALFILDDMIEFLSADYLQDKYVHVANHIIKFCGASDPALRQAACYGIGMMAKHGGLAYTSVNDNCLQGLKIALEYTMTNAIKGKKQKEKKFNYARDNAISALGKIIRY